MLRQVISISLILGVYFLSLGTSDSFGRDEDGCLTCHQYPGLVRLEKGDGIRVLHIDERKYYKSPHGKFRCKECHTAISKVPHTGETSTDCTSECHQDDAAKIRNYPLKTLHNKEQSYIVSLKVGSSCRTCHPIYPHSENQMVRAFLNMHTGYMFCEVCHIKRGKFNQLDYDWKDTENADFSGEPFGTYFNPQTNTAHKADEHFISRIAVFSMDGGKKKELIDVEDAEDAKEFMAVKNKVQPEVAKEKLTYFHRNVEKKEISVACNECHAADSILDFKKLGFDEKKTKDLIYINIKGLVTKYKVFYFPQLFDK
jgi:hypothetical protein